MGEVRHLQAIRRKRGSRCREHRSRHRAVFGARERRIQRGHGILASQLRQRPLQCLRVTIHYPLHLLLILMKSKEITATIIRAENEILLLSEEKKRHVDELADIKDLMRKMREQ